jgi:short-subunit dehydrogenase
MAHENGNGKDSKPWALVTGASAGIGAEFCRQLAAQGYQLVLIARRADRMKDIANQLQAAHGTTSIIITVDLSRPDASQSIINRLDEEGVEIEYLVNNAGYGIAGSFHVPDWQDHADFIQVMMTAVCELTWRLLPGMQARGRGYIINVASVAGLAPASAGHTLYGASKSFLIKFSEALAQENLDKGVKVCALCPGFTYSEFHDVSGTREMISQLPAYLWLDAKDVVADAIRAMSAAKVKLLVIPGRQYKFTVFVSRYLPWLATILSKRTSKYWRQTD